MKSLKATAKARVLHIELNCVRMSTLGVNESTSNSEQLGLVKKRKKKRHANGAQSELQAKVKESCKLKPERYKAWREIQEKQVQAKTRLELEGTRMLEPTTMAA